MIVNKLLPKGQFRGVLGAWYDIGGRVQVARAEPSLDGGSFEVLQLFQLFLLKVYGQEIR